jgi:hypothetical protein
MRWTSTTTSAKRECNQLQYCYLSLIHNRIVLATHQERKGLQKPFVIRFYRPRPDATSRNVDSDTTNINMLQACRATLSAPTHFESVKIQGLGGSFRDASVTIPNAIYETYHEVRDSKRSQIRFMMCFGLSSPTISSKSPQRPPLGELDNSLAAEAKAHRFKYHRFADVDLTSRLEGDSQAKIKKTKCRVQEYCCEAANDKALEKWAKRLVKYRRLRAETTQWSEYTGLISHSPNPEVYRPGLSL